MMMKKYRDILETTHTYISERERKRPSKKTNVCLDDAIDAKLHTSELTTTMTRN